MPCTETLPWNYRPCRGFSQRSQWSGRRWGGQGTGCERRLRGLGRRARTTGQQRQSHYTRWRRGRKWRWWLECRCQPRPCGHCNWQDWVEKGNWYKKEGITMGVFHKCLLQCTALQFHLIFGTYTELNSNCEEILLITKELWTAKFQQNSTGFWKWNWTEFY